MKFEYREERNVCECEGWIEKEACEERYQDSIQGVAGDKGCIPEVGFVGRENRVRSRRSIGVVVAVVGHVQMKLHLSSGGFLFVYLNQRVSKSRWMILGNCREAKQSGQEFIVVDSSGSFLLNDMYRNIISMVQYGTM